MGSAGPIRSWCPIQLQANCASHSNWQICWLLSLRSCTHLNKKQQQQMLNPHIILDAARIKRLVTRCSVPLRMVFGAVVGSRQLGAHQSLDIFSFCSEYVIYWLFFFKILFYLNRYPRIKKEFFKSEESSGTTYDRALISFTLHTTTTYICMYVCIYVCMQLQQPRFPINIIAETVSPRLVHIPAG